MKLAFISVPAGDYEASKKFYEEVLALPVIREFNGKPHRETDYDLGNARLKVFEWTQPWYGGHHTSFMISTDDLDGVLKKVRDAGYEARPVEITEWGGRIAAVRDPFGNFINLMDANQQGSS